MFPTHSLDTCWRRKNNTTLLAQESVHSIEMQEQTKYGIGIIETDNRSFSTLIFGCHECYDNGTFWTNDRKLQKWSKCYWLHITNSYNIRQTDIEQYTAAAPVNDQMNCSENFPLLNFSHVSQSLLIFAAPKKKKKRNQTKAVFCKIPKSRIERTTHVD